ncbi:MAG: VUT family protein [Legionellaceae bacterium]|nr:VUT family protein [Legionellaceae bacterium]
MRIVWLALVCEALFSLLIAIVIHMPTYGIGDYQDQYTNVLGNMWVFITGGIVSNAIAGLLNIYFMSRWKILTQGKMFWFRSILATCISEFILIIVTVFIAFLPYIKLQMTMKIFIDAYILEIIYAILFVVPAKLLVNFLRYTENIDAYDYGVSYNPFKIFYNGDSNESRYIGRNA